MSLQKLKELEDAKKALQSVNSQYTALHIDRKQSMFATAKAEFESFFKQQGFLVNTTQNLYEANYGTLIVRLSFPKVEDSFIGAYSVWDLEYNNKKYSVMINRMGHYPSVSTSYSSTPKTEEERIQQQIDTVLKQTTEAQEKVATFNDSPWGFGLVEKNESKTGFKYPQFNTFTELLEALTK